MAFIQLIEDRSTTPGGRKVTLNTGYIERIEPDPKAPTTTLVKMSDGKRLVILGDYDAVSSQITSAHRQALKP